MKFDDPWVRWVESGGWDTKHNNKIQASQPIDVTECACLVIGDGIGIKPVQLLLSALLDVVDQTVDCITPQSTSLSF